MPLPKFEWTWSERGGTSGVQLRHGELFWWTTPGGPNGRFGEAAAAQSFADFRARGPLDSSVPPEVLAILRARVGPG